MRIGIPGSGLMGAKLAPSFTHAKEIALFMGQLAYEGDGGAALAYRFEHFEELERP